MQQQLTLWDSITSNILGEIRSDGDMLSLTDLWRSAGMPSNKELKDWLRLPQTEGFILALSKFQKVEKSHLLKIKRGKTGGTWGIKDIALEYAQYLDPQLAVLVNKVFFERVEQEKNPDLAIDQARRSWKRLGKSDTWINKRVESIATRKHFCGVLSAHGVDQKGFGDCTNAIYRPLFGCGAKGLREKKQLPDKANTRESMSAVELAGVSLAELLASEKIKEEHLNGNRQCERASLLASNNVRMAILENRKTFVNSAF